MFVSKRLFGAVSLSLMAMGVCLPAQAQTVLMTESGTDTSIVSELPEVIEPELTSLDEVSFEDSVVADISLIETQSESQLPVAIEGFSLDDLRVESTTVLSEGEPAITTTEVAPESEAEIAPEVAITEPTLEVEIAQPVADQPVTEASELSYPAIDETIVESTEIAQRRPRRRTSGARGGSNYIGIGADFGYADDFSFAAISKFEFTDRLAVRPAVLFGDDFSVLVPITVDFTGVNPNVGGFQLRPYAGAGVSYISDDDEDINLLLSAGVDVPLSQQFTANAQVNWGVLNDSDFGVTVGIGYNLGNFFR